MSYTIHKIFIAAVILSFTNQLLAQSETTSPPITNGVSMEKGIKFALLTFSLSDRRAENDQEFLTYYIDQTQTSWGVSTDLGFLLKKNFGAGLGFSYGQTNEDNMTENSLGLITENDIRIRRFAIRPFVKSFIPLNAKNQIFIILQTELQYSTEKSDLESKMLFNVTETNSTKQIYGLGFRPGIMLFVIRNFALETNVNVLGISTSVEKASTTGQPDSNVTTTNIDFKIDLLQLNFGFSMYF